MNKEAYELIRALLIEGKQKAWRLNCGLGLAYTPPNGIGETHRLAASRVGVEIDEKEAAELQASFMAAMRKRGWVGNGRFPIKPASEEVYKNGNTHHLLVWTWVIATVEL